jgi:hypothetical protein
MNILHKYYIYTARYINSIYRQNIRLFRTKLINFFLNHAFNFLLYQPLDINSLKILDIAFFNYYDIIDKEKLTNIVDKLFHILVAFNFFLLVPDESTCKSVLHCMKLYENNKFLPLLELKIYIINNSYIFHMLFNCKNATEYSIRINLPTLLDILHRIKYNKLKIKVINNTDNTISNRLMALGSISFNRCL